MIKLIDVKETPQLGACKYKFTVQIVKMGMEIRDCGQFESNGKKWIGLPSRQYESDGQKKYFPLIKFEEGMKQRFDAAVFAELVKAIEAMKSSKKDDQFQEEPDLPF